MEDYMLIKKCKLMLLTLLLLPLFMSCGRIIYQYGGINYDTYELALEAQKADLDLKLQSIQKTSTPVGGSVSVILPSRVYIRNNFITTKGNISSDDTQITLMYEHYTTFIYNAFKSTGEAIEKRGIFDKAFYVYSDDPENANFTDDFSVILFKGKEGKEQWSMKRKKDNPIRLIDIGNLTMALPPVQRLIVWLDKLEKIAKGE
jgi:hypothetical protein